MRYRMWWRRGIAIGASVLLAAAVGCGGDEDDSGGSANSGGNQEANSGANGGGNGGGGNGGASNSGGGTSLELRAEDSFEVTHEAALKRYFLVNDMINRRMTELLQFRDGDLVEMLHDALDGEGSLACGDEGSVELSPASQTAVSPFDDEETTLEGTTYVFEDCVLGEIDELAAQIDYRLYGTVTVMEDDNRLISIEFSDDFEVRRDGSLVGEDFVDRRYSDVSLLYRIAETGSRGSIDGQWQSNGYFNISDLDIEEAYQFDLLGYGGEGEASLLLRDVTDPGESNSTNWSDRSFRVQVDRIDTDGDDCIAWGQFDVESEMVELEGMGEQRVDTITSGGVSAVVQPSGSSFSEPLEVVIDGDAQAFSSNDTADIRDEVQGTCRSELVGYGL